MKKIKQFRYSTDPTFTTFDGNNPINGQTNFLNFGNEYFSNVSQIGIQGIPGTRFWLNEGYNSSNEYAITGIVLNWTGIFELDLTPINGQITSLVFDKDSARYYENGEKLIVDILYDTDLMQGGAL